MLRRLCPERLPVNWPLRDEEVPRFFSPELLLSAWSDRLRRRLAAEARKTRFKLEQPGPAFYRAGWIATGVFRAGKDAPPSEAFPVIDGYCFGAVIMHGGQNGDMGGYTLELEPGIRAPVVERLAHFTAQAALPPEGYAAAVYEEAGKRFGLTAAHVVPRQRRGERVPVACSVCGVSARLENRAPGLLDAAKIEYVCDCQPGLPSGAHMRRAMEGETVRLHLGRSGLRRATVAMSLSSPSEILTAALPRHFLTDVHGHFGDSGSLVASDHQDPGQADLIGLYLGEADSENPDQTFATYGYALNLCQAARVLRASDLVGEFHD